jgi:hypothetical protein
MNPTILEIPLVPSTAQTFTVTLVGITYTFTIQWCPPAACWILNIGDLNNVPIVFGIPIITGTDLLSAFGYLDFGFQLIATSDFDNDAVPTFDNLGLTGHLYAVVLATSS